MAQRKKETQVSLLYGEASERYLLGAMLWGSEEALKAGLSLTSEAFFLPAHRIIFEAIRDIHAKDRTVSLTVVRDYLEAAGNLAVAGGADYLSELYSFLPDSGMIAAAVQELREWQCKRAVNAILSDNIARLGSPETSWSECISSCISDLRTLHQSFGTQDVHDITAYAAVNRLYEELLARRAERRESARRYPMTGLPQIDDAQAGLRPEEMMIIAARPGVGKSALGLFIGLNVAMGAANGASHGGSVFYSLEMSEQQVAARIASMCGEVDGMSLRRLSVSESTVEQVRQVRDALQPLPYYVDTSVGMNVENLCLRLYNLTAQASISVAIVDYLQLMSSSKSRGNRVMEVTEVSRRLKQLATETGICIIAISQMSREIERSRRRDPVLADLRESGAIEQDADSVLFLMPDGNGIMQMDARTFELSGDIPPEGDESLTRFTFRVRNPDGSEAVVDDVRNLRQAVIDIGGEVNRWDESVNSDSNCITFEFSLKRDKFEQLQDYLVRHYTSGQLTSISIVRDNMFLRAMLMKNRHGPAVTTRLCFVRPHGRFYEVTTAYG